jgi:hypothetical protein
MINIMYSTPAKLCFLGHQSWPTFPDWDLAAGENDGLIEQQTATITGDAIGYSRYI